MHWKAIEESLITYSKIINDENNKITTLKNKNKWKQVRIFENLKMLIVIINDFILIFFTYICIY